MSKKTTNRGSSLSEPPFITLGKIVRPHGVRGELRMQIMTAYPDHILRLKTVYLNRKQDPDSAKAYTLEQARLHGDVALLFFDGVENRTDAEYFRGQYVMVPFAEGAPPLEEGEIYLLQLLGLEVYTDMGTFLGKITNIIETGANDVYLLEGTQWGDILIPDTEEVVREIDLNAQKVIIHPIPGLLPDDYGK